MYPTTLIRAACRRRLCRYPWRSRRRSNGGCASAALPSWRGSRARVTLWQILLGAAKQGETAEGESFPTRWGPPPVINGAITPCK